MIHKLRIKPEIKWSSEYILRLSGLTKSVLLESRERQKKRVRVEKGTKGQTTPRVGWPRLWHIPERGRESRQMLRVDDEMVRWHHGQSGTDDNDNALLSQKYKITDWCNNKTKITTITSLQKLCKLGRTQRRGPCWDAVYSTKRKEHSVVDEDNREK